MGCSGARRLGKTGLAREAVAGGSGVLSLSGAGRDGEAGAPGRPDDPGERLETLGDCELAGRTLERLAG